ncbi:1-pyrroline-5-carboxylate dehydrogenase, partial [Serendipita sp. 399]
GKPGFDKIVGYIEKAKQEGGEILCGGTADGSKGFFIQPTVILTKDPKSITMREEIFGPVVTVYVYQDEDLDQTLELINTTTDYALTGAIFAQGRSALIKTSNALRNAAGNMYYNEKCTGAVVGQQPFGGSRASGTNDKAGSVALFWRFVSARSIKEGQKLTMKRIIVPLRVSNGIAVRLARPPQMALEPRLAELQTQLASADRLDEDPVLNIITRGLSDQEADWTLDDINAVISSSEDVELNALDLCPLLWQYIPENDGAIRLLNTITLKASSKECIIALQETQDTLSTKLSEWAQRDQEDDAGHQLVESLSLLLQLYENVIPRLMLRKKGPTETLSQLIRGINVVVQVGSTAADKKLGRRLLECLSKFITATARWVRSSPSTSDDEKSNCNDLLATLLFSGVGTCGSYIQAHNAERYLESHFSRRYLHSNVDNEAFQGQAIASVIIVGVL